ALGRVLRWLGLHTLQGAGTVAGSMMRREPAPAAAPAFAMPGAGPAARPRFARANPPGPRNTDPGDEPAPARPPIILGGGDRPSPAPRTLPDPTKRPAVADPRVLEQNAAALEQVLSDFGVRGSIVKVNPGPVVTLYELEPAPGTKSSRVIGLADDIARSMSAVSARVAVVAGRNAIGIELPNAHREKVYPRELLTTTDESHATLPLCLGTNI